jgi:ABC-type oligopeptide transport system substrate-binding subunit
VEAGYPEGNGLPILEGLTYPLPNFRLCCKFLREHWLESLGIDIHWDYVDDTLETLMQGKQAHLDFDGWGADYPAPDTFLRDGLVVFRDFVYYEGYDSLIDKARREVNQEERIHIFRDLDRQLVENAILVPMVYPRFHCLIKPWVRQFVLKPFVAELWNVILEPHE